MSKELVGVSTNDLEREAGRREWLQWISHKYALIGAFSGFSSVVITSGREESALGISCFILTIATFGVSSKINMGRIQAINREVDLRGGREESPATGLVDIPFRRIRLPI